MPTTKNRRKSATVNGVQQLIGTAPELYENVLEHPILKTLIFVIRVDIPFSI